MTEEDAKVIKEVYCKEYDELEKALVEEMYKELPAGEDRDIQVAKLREHVAYKKKCVEKLDPNGLPALMFILLCSVPKALGGKDATCGGTVLPGFSYDDCDSTIAVNNIIDALVEMDIIQVVDENDNCKVSVENARKCRITKEELEEAVRWSCHAYSSPEAKRAARLMTPYLQACAALNVPTIVIEAGGVTKNSSEVVDNLDKSLITVLICNLVHIQFFNRVDDRVLVMIKGMSGVFGELCTVLGVEPPKSFEEIFCSKANFGSSLVSCERGGEAAGKLMIMAAALRKVEGGETLSLEAAELYTELEERWGEKKLDDKMTRRLDAFAVKALASAIHSRKPLPPDMIRLQSELETVYTKQGLADKLKGMCNEYSVRALSSAIYSRKPLPPDMIRLQSELETVYTKQGLADKLKGMLDTYKVQQYASAVNSGEPLSPEMLNLRAELESVHGGKKKLEEMVENRQAGWDRSTDLNRYASAIRRGDPLSPEMLKLQAELETHYGGKKALDAKVKKVNAGKDKNINIKTKQVHDRNVNELGMIEAKPEETVIQQCPNCKKEKNTTHIFIEENGERKIVLDQCFSRSNGLTKQCDHTMKVKPSNKKTQSTISRRTVIRRKNASVVSSDEPSSSDVDTDTDTPPSTMTSVDLQRWEANTIKSLVDGGSEVIAVMSGCADFDRDKEMFNILGQWSAYQHNLSDTFDLSAACHEFNDMSCPPDGCYNGSFGFTLGDERTQVQDSVKLYFESGGIGILVISGEGESDKGCYKVAGMMRRSDGKLSMVRYSSNYIGWSSEQRELAMEVNRFNPHQLSAYEQSELLDTVKDLMGLSDDDIQSATISSSSDESMDGIDKSVINSDVESDDVTVDSIGESSVEFDYFDVSIVSDETPTTPKQKALSKPTLVESPVTPTTTLKFLESYYQNGGQLKRSAESALPWKCPKCTFLNDTTAIECICGYKFREAKKSCSICC